MSPPEKAAAGWEPAAEGRSAPEAEQLQHDDTPAQRPSATGFTPLLDQAVSRWGLTTAAVFGRVLRFNMMRRGRCDASLDTLAMGLHLDEKTVRRSLRRLVSDGTLEAAKRGGRSTVYVVSEGGWAVAGVLERAERRARPRESTPTQRGHPHPRGRASAPGGSGIGTPEERSKETSVEKGIEDTADGAPAPSSDEHSSAQSSWENTKAAVRPFWGRNLWEKYLSPSVGRRLDGDRLLVDVPDADSLAWLGDRALKQLRREASVSVGREVTLTLTVDFEQGGLAAKVRAEELASKEE